MIKFNALLIVLLALFFGGCQQKDLSSLSPCKRKCAEQLESCAASRESRQMTCEMMQTQCSSGCEQFRQ
jgi:outer membrane lipoprotein-sorting protein